MPENAVYMNYPGLKTILSIALVLGFSISVFSGTFTSVKDGNWNKGATWGNAGDVEGTDWPAATDNAVIATGTAVKLTANRTINDLTIQDGGEFDYEGFTLTLNGTVIPSFVSDQSGNWDAAGTWLGSPGTPGTTDKVIISRDHTVLLTGNTTVATLIINAGAVLDDDNSGDLTISTKLVLNGERQGKKSTTLLDGGELDGSGNHYSTKELEVDGSASVTILSTANVSISAEFKLNGGSTVTNNGTITAAEIKDNNASDTWINAANASVTSLKDIMSNGTLTATASGNTVAYARQGDSDVTVPTSSTYYNLGIAGSGTKTLLGNLTITGGLTISSTLDTDVGNNFSLDIEGDWTNSGSFTANTSTVTFDGTGNQTITNTSGETFYNMTVNKSSGVLSINDDVTVSNTLTMSSGNISTGSNVLTLGDATANEGTLSRTGGTIIGSFERWIAAGTVNKLLFPVGTSSLYVPAEPTFDDGGKTGGTVIVRFVESNPGNEGLSLDDNGTMVYNTFVEGYWDFTSANSFAPGTGFDLDLTGTGMSSFTIEAATRILKRTNAQSDWVTEGDHDAAVGNVAKRLNLTGLAAQYALADDTNCTAPQTFAITGDTEVCTGDTDDTYSVTLNSGNTYYWSVTGGTIDGASSGVDVNSITVDWGSTGQVGNVNVHEENTCTRSDDVDLAVNINTLPTSSITGSTNIAEDQTGVSYSVESNAGYSYAWTIDGGTKASGGTTNNITVDWGDAGSGSVSVVASSSCSADADAVSLNVEIYALVLSVQSGDWDDASTWECNCEPTDFQSVNVLDGHRVTLTGDETIQNITIDAGGVIDQDDNKLKIEGNLILNGTITGNSGNKAVEIKGGAGTTLDGSGTLSISSGGTLALKIKGEAAIESTADLLVIGDVEIDNKKVVTNNGKIIFNDNVEGKGAEAVWLNASGSYLKVGGEIFSTNGTLKASQTGNTVEYATTDAAGATVTTPLNSKYYNLTLSGSVDNETEDDLIILGDLTISSGDFDISANTNDLTIQGDWVNTGTFTEGNQTVTFTGTNAQEITNSNGETFYNLTVNKSSGTLSLSDNVTVSNTLTMTVGDINTGSSKLTLGTGTGNEGTLAYTDGTVIGQFERWIAAGTTAKRLFPIGTANNYRPAEPTFSDGGKTGGTVTAQFVASNPGNAGLTSGLDDNGQTTIYNSFVEGYWDFSSANSFTPGSSFDLDLTGAGFSSFTIDTDTRIITRGSSSDDWTAEGSHDPAVDPVAKRTGLTTLPAQYAFGDDTNCTAPGAPTFSGDTDVCKGDTGDTYTITSSTSGITDYTWSVTGGAIASGQGTGTVTINWNNTAQVGSVGLAVTNSCTISEETLTSVNVHTIKPTSITGDKLVPQNEQDVVYSVTLTSDYTYSWTVNGGTIDGSASGLEQNTVTVDWGTAGTGQVSVTAQKTGCTVTDALTAPVDVYVVIESAASGDWDNTATWECGCVPGIGDNPTIVNGQTVTLDIDASINNLIVESGGSIEMDGTDRTLAVDGDFTIDGSISVPVTNTSMTIDLTGVGAEIGGTGTVDPSNGTGTGTVQVTGGNKTIASTAVLTVSNADFDIATGLSVTNSGSLTLTNDLVAADGTNTWTNSTNATLKVDGVLMSNGVLVASATGNTVNYNGGAQNVKDPTNSRYYHLTIGGTGTKNLQANTDINGDLTITGTGVLDITAGNNYALTVAGDWTNNSSAGDAFLQQSGTVTFDGSAEQTITGTETFYDLVFNNTTTGNAVTLAGPVTASNSLTLTDGQIVTTSTNILDLAAGGTFSFVNGSFVEGPFRRRVASTSSTSLDFPVGKNDDMHRATLTVTQDATTETTYTTEYFPSAPTSRTKPETIDHVSGLSYWNIAKGTGAGITNGQVTLYYTSYDEVDTEADLRVVKDDGGGNWLDLGGTGSGSPSGSITSATNFTSFSDFTMGSTSSDNPLPVTLVSFEAEVEREIVVLTWKTANEINNDYFILERSSDGESFKDYRLVVGAGNSEIPRNYSVIDDTPIPGINYYRLKQVDFDGTISYHGILRVEVGAGLRPVVSVFPNPLTGPSVIVGVTHFAGPGEVTIEITDLKGAPVFRRIFTEWSEDQRLDLPRNLKNGVYLIRTILGDEEVITSRIILRQ